MLINREKDRFLRNLTLPEAKKLSEEQIAGLLHDIGIAYPKSGEDNLPERPIAIAMGMLLYLS